MDQIRMGVIGCTGRGGIAQAWHKPGGRSVVVGAADVSEGALGWFKEHVNPDGFVTTDHRELLARKDIDAIAVTSPDWTHEQYVCDAFEAGKHVFTEKPMAITVEGCDRMLRAWLNSGRKFMVGFNMRYMNIFRVMKDVVDSGEIGEVKVVWVRHFVGHGGEWYYHDWHAASKYSTGLLLQKASHDIDMIHWITGQYGVRVAASGGLDYYGGDAPNDLRCPACEKKDTCVEFQDVARAAENKRNLCVYRQEVDVEDNSVLMMELDGGIKATYMQCHFTPDYCRNYTFIGTEGRLENLDDNRRVIVRLRDRSNRWKNLAHRDVEVKPAKGGHGGADPLVCTDFIDMLLNDTRPVATPLAGRMSVAVGVTATQSIRNGWAAMTVPPVPEDIRDRVF
ncbi:MAG: Gfo/Idh/MocA family oxidoreductase [Kiritimatiellae bacterium]|nr:Gfo/Idh/MocA family oxidoreductase [Kiritimatiellia bacterium]